ncbi:MAG: ATP synthase F0 subunit B [Deltaproteobacteria bacterium]|nr:ATP synthase F0 subunit B [Deltaproteobacteria bacterium]
MIDLNYTLWIQMVNFLVLIFILYVLLYKPILNIIDKRESVIDESKERVRSLEQAAGDKMAQYDEQLRQARSEAAGQRDELKEEGSQTAKQIMQAARNEIAETISDLKAKMEREREEARAILREKTKDIALEISEKVLGRGV